jgi:hypothetical protein
MNTGRFATPGKTRSCPHCKATILDSATVCPGCNHHLRFDSVSTGQRQPALTPLRVEGTLRHPPNGTTWEYSVVLTIRNARGQEVARQVVGVGALQPAEERVFTLAVEVFKPAEIAEVKPDAASTAQPPQSRPPGRPSPPNAPSRPLPAATASGSQAPPAAGSSGTYRSPASPGSSGTFRSPAAPTPPGTLRSPSTGASRPPASPAQAAPGAPTLPAGSSWGNARGAPRSSPAQVNGAGVSQSGGAGLKDPRAPASDPKPQPKRS